MAPLIPPLLIDKAHARRFVLRHQGLLPPRQLSGKAGVLKFIRRVNCIQYDPINVVGQNPHLVLQSRVRDYRPEMLNALLYEDRKLVDGFDKQMSIYPIEDWPDFAYYREQKIREYRESASTAPAVRLMAPVREQVEIRGPISSLELEDQTRMDWWLSDSVRVARIALDLLLYGGETVVDHRVGTRRYFDLAERVVPSKFRKISRPHASADEYLEWHVFRRAGGLGLVNLKVTAAFGGTIGWRGGRIRAAILRLVEQGRLMPVNIAELPRQSFFIRREDLPALDAAAGREDSAPNAALIAPLDNLMWDQSLVKALFDFDYAWEVYKPPEKRVYGYYVLPVLAGDRFIARLDPEFDRPSRTLVIRNGWWEAGMRKIDAATREAIGTCLADFGRYLGADSIRLGPEIQRDRGWAEAVRRAVAGGN